MSHVVKKVKSATLKVRIKTSGRKIKSLSQALAPEVSSGNRCNMKILEDSTSGIILLEFESNELAPLRASLNTNLRLVSASLKAIESVSKSA